MTRIPFQPGWPRSQGRLVPAMIAVLVAASLWALAPFYALDQRWSDGRLLPKAMPVAAPILVVEITPQDVAQFDGPPVGRNHLARALTLLNEASAQRILVDLLFAAPISPASDQMLVDALQSLGPQRVGLASAMDPSAQPHPMFTQGLPVLDARIFADPDGWYRRLGRSDGLGGANPAHWLATGQERALAVPFDRRMDLHSIQTISLGGLLDGAFDQRVLTDRLVIIAQSAELGAQRIPLPGAGHTARGRILALAAASDLSEHGQASKYAEQAGIALAALALAMGYGIATRLTSVGVTALSAITLAGLLYGACLWINTRWGAGAMPHATIIVMASGMLVDFAQRMRLGSLVSTFFRGNMSPEETWDWNAQSNRAEAVILLDGNGSTKRLNPAGQALSALYGDCLIAALNSLSGDRREQVNVNDRVFALEWPNASLPLVILRDVTQVVAQEEHLRAKLVTDGLTGLLNRAGFDEALGEIDATSPDGYAIFYMDMNGFKAVNDTHGHSAGDALLGIAGQAVADCVRTQDKVARLGGDEFAIVAPGPWTLRSAQVLANQLEASLAEPVALGEAVVRVGMAVGFAIRQDPSELASSVVERADHAMYARKTQIKSQQVRHAARAA